MTSNSAGFLQRNILIQEMNYEDLNTINNSFSLSVIQSTGICSFLEASILGSMFVGFENVGLCIQGFLGILASELPSNLQMCFFLWNLKITDISSSQSSLFFASFKTEGKLASRYIHQRPSCTHNGRCGIRNS